MVKKKVVVLLSAYNGERFIKQQINSIFEQTGLDSLTLIVRNDGSTDNTLEILHNMQERYNNLEIIDGKNKGLVASFFELLNYAVKKGFDFYSFSDQDDYWLPEKLSTAIKEIETFDSPCMYSACSTITDEELRPTGGVTQKKLKEISFYNTAIQNFCPGHNQVLNHQLAKKVVQNTQYSPDIYSHDLWITNVAIVTGTILFDNTSHTLYRQHKNNQLSFGKSKVDWVIDHMKRLSKGEGKKIAKQLAYFVESYGEFLSKEQYEEISGFLTVDSSPIKRLKYIYHTKIYRQREYETALFKLLYLFGGYKIDTKTILNSSKMSSSEV